MTSQRLDGLAVSLWQLRFSGTLEIDDQSAGDLRLDGTIVVLAAGRVGDLALKVLDSGEVRRTNVLRISDYLVLTGEVRDRGIDALSNGLAHGVLTPPTWSGEDETMAAAFEHERLSAFLQQQYPEQIGDESAGEMAIRLLRDPRVKAVLRDEGVVIDEGGTIVTSEPQVEPESEDTETPRGESPPEPEPQPEPESTEDEPPVDDDGGMGDETEMGPVEHLGNVNDRSRLAPDGDAPRGRGDGPKVAPFNPDAWEQPGNGDEPEVTEREQLGSVYSQPSKRDPVLAKFLEEG